MRELKLLRAMSLEIQKGALIVIYRDNVRGGIFSFRGGGNSKKIELGLRREKDSRTTAGSDHVVFPGLLSMASNRLKQLRAGHPVT
jgi:hypothetical protein